MNKASVKIFVIILAVAYFIYYLLTPKDWHFIDNFNLLIHEAGHWIFWPFGEFFNVLGGSLNQILVPMLFVIYFYRQGQNYSAALTLFWVGQNLINISVYCGDAVAMRLPLLGGDAAIHDWNWLLIYMGQLHHTAGIALAIKIAGILLGLLSALWATFSMFKPEGRITYDQ